MSDRSLLTSALERLRAGGALAAEVLCTRTEWLEQSGAAPTRGESARWEARAWKSGGVAGAGAGADATAAVEAALAALAAASPDPDAAPADRQDVRSAGLGIADRRYPSIDPADRADLLDDAARAFDRAPGGVALRDLRYREQRDERLWSNSRGVDLTEVSTRFRLDATVALPDGRTLAHGIASRHFADVASLPFGPDLRRRALPLARRLTGPLPERPLVVEPRAMAALVRALAPAFAAGHGGFLQRWIADAPPPARGREPLRLAPALLHVTDDAGLHAGLHTHAFDDRGVTPLPLTLLREGVIAARYHSPESARAARARPTGHVRDGALRPSNLVVRPGSRTRNMIHAALGDVLVLDAPPPIDLQAGRLRGPAELVHLVGGEPVGAYAVSFDVSVAAFLAGIVELASDQERHAGVDTPTAVWERASLAD